MTRPEVSPNGSHVSGVPGDAGKPEDQARPERSDASKSPGTGTGSAATSSAATPGPPTPSAEKPKAESSSEQPASSTSGASARSETPPAAKQQTPSTTEATALQPTVAPEQKTRDTPTPKRRPKPYDESVKATKAKPKKAPRKANLHLARVDPWSVMKMGFALSMALAIVTVVAITIVWAVLGAAGVWDAINSSVATVLSDNASNFDITEYVGFGRIIGLSLVIAAIDVVLITALATIGAFLYNLTATLLGGLEVTLAEDA